MRECREHEEFLQLIRIAGLEEQFQEGGLHSADVRLWGSQVSNVLPFSTALLITALAGNGSQGG